MIDISTQKPLTVSTTDSGPYITVPLEQLPDVCKVLDSNDVRYWADEGAISINDRPFITVVNISRGTDAEAIQAFLDDAN